MTQATLGGRLNMSQVNVSRRLLGQRGWRVEELVALTSTFRVTVDQLMRPQGA